MERDREDCKSCDKLRTGFDEMERCYESVRKQRDEAVLQIDEWRDRYDRKAKDAAEQGRDLIVAERLNSDLRSALEKILLEYNLTGSADSCFKCGPRDSHNPGCLFEAGWKVLGTPLKRKEPS